MPDPLAHHPSMLIIRHNSLPRLWWLFPWTTVRHLHRAATAFHALADDQHRVIEMQTRLIDDMDDRIMRGASVPDARPIPEDCES